KPSRGLDVHNVFGKGESQGEISFFPCSLLLEVTSRFGEREYNIPQFPKQNPPLLPNKLLSFFMNQ
ncbi:hypothetical protein VU10_06890, partial [Desulfobulbus sp. US1]|nr:hypothetical protein [Desulfobulbus sp. US1]